MSAIGVRVGRVRVEDVRRDPLATQIALDRALAGASLRPRSLPPSAILVVRILRDPLPLRLGLESGLGRPPPEWEDAVAGSLDALTRAAARPALGAVPANAVAVCFADRAELLACLASDWAAGVAAAQWWWRLLVLGDPAVRVPAELRSSPAYVPAAFELLAARGEAVAVAAALPPEEAHALAAIVAATFGVRRPSALLAPVDAREEPPGRLEPAALPASRALEAPLLRHAPEALAPGLQPAQRRLLALALTLRRAPAETRAATAPEAVAAARPSQPTPPAPSAPRPRELRALAREDRHPPAPLTAPPVSTVPRHPKSSTPPAAPPHQDADEPPPSRATGPPSRPDDPHASEPERAPAAAEDTSTTRPQSSARVRRRQAPHGRKPAPPPPRRQPSADETRILDPPVETGLGGLFYLVNVGIDLGLYGDFTQPSHPGIDLDPWDFVTLVGRALLGEAQDGDDAVWALLAALAGREPESEPGAGFRPPGRESVATWTRNVEAEIRTLLDAVDLDPGLLLRRPALVHVSEAHVDVVFALADHPIEIRIAGLDRDPGFVPAAGRHVAFHFE